MWDVWFCDRCNEVFLFISSVRAPTRTHEDCEGESHPLRWLDYYSPDISEHLVLKDAGLRIDGFESMIKTH